MINRPRVKKAPGELFDVRIEFRNSDPNIIYVIQAISMVTILEEITLVDKSSEMHLGVRDTIGRVNPSNPTGPRIDTDTANVWIQGGTAGKNYLLTATVTMESGQILSEAVLVEVR